MENIRIIATDNRTIVVKADTKKYGNDAVMYEGHTFMQCCDYIRRKVGSNHFKLDALPYTPMFTDTEGRTLPRIHSVHL